MQDLLNALLRLYFYDIRPEEYTPSYAGKTARVDFLLKNEKIVCFVYDPEERIRNPISIVNDLNKQHNGFVTVIIKP